VPASLDARFTTTKTRTWTPLTLYAQVNILTSARSQYAADALFSSSDVPQVQL
jgi:hypothetical protein